MGNPTIGPDSEAPTPDRQRKPTCPRCTADLIVRPGSCPGDKRLLGCPECGADLELLWSASLGKWGVRSASPVDDQEPYPGYSDGAPPPDLGCPLPPKPWYCSLPPGHEGPCPTRLRIELDDYWGAAIEYQRTVDAGPFEFVGFHPPVLNAYKRVGITVSPALLADEDPGLCFYEGLIDALCYNEHLIPAPRPWWLPRSLQTFLLGRLTKTVRCRRGA